MLRISASNCKEGMLLARAVLDSAGREVAPKNTKLTEEDARQIALKSSGQIFIDDTRSNGIIVAPLFPDHLQSKALSELNGLLADLGASDQPIGARQLGGLKFSIRQLVTALFPLAVGEPDTDGCVSIKSYDVVHPVKTAVFAMHLGRIAGFDQDTLRNLGLAALLMNVGYARLDPGIRGKASELEADELAQLQRHPEIGCSLLDNGDLAADVILAIRQHHERFDGKGYPGNLRGQEISPLAQIVAISDVFHALISVRPHRPPVKRHEAVEFILANSGEMFDPELVQFFSRSMPHWQTGSMVRLSTGEVGIIVDPNVGHVARPVVRVISQSGLVVSPYEIDLSNVELMKTFVLGVAA